MRTQTPETRPVLKPLILVALVFLFASHPAFATFESSLAGIKHTLTHEILPVLSVIGLVCAAISLYTGSPNAKQNIAYAIIGCIIGFGAQAIVDLISTTVR